MCHIVFNRPKTAHTKEHMYAKVCVYVISWLCKGGVRLLVVFDVAVSNCSPASAQLFLSS